MQMKIAEVCHLDYSSRHSSVLRVVVVPPMLQYAAPFFLSSTRPFRAKQIETCAPYAWHHTRAASWFITLSGNCGSAANSSLLSALHWNDCTELTAKRGCFLVCWLQKCRGTQLINAFKASVRKGPALTVTCHRTVLLWNCHRDGRWRLIMRLMPRLVIWIGAGAQCTSDSLPKIPSIY